MAKERCESAASLRSAVEGRGRPPTLRPGQATLTIAIKRDAALTIAINENKGIRGRSELGQVWVCYRRGLETLSDGCAEISPTAPRRRTNSAHSRPSRSTQTGAHHQWRQQVALRPSELADASRGKEGRKKDQIRSISRTATASHFFPNTAIAFTGQRRQPRKRRWQISLPKQC